MPYLPGRKPVLELLASAPTSIARIYHSQSRPGAENHRLLELCHKWHIPLEEVTSGRLVDLCGPHVAHQGVVALIVDTPQLSLTSLLDSAASAPLPLLIALDQVRDPGNLGAIARSAWAMGCAGLLLPRHNSAGFAPAAFKTSAGALSQLPVSICVNLARALDECEEHGFSIYGAAASAQGNNAFTMRWHLPAVLVMGSEGSGIRPGVLKRCQALAAIPMERPFNSLNVAQAAAMLIALCAAQQHNALR